MIVTDFKENMTSAERETREALALYKAALINASYRGWGHRVGLFFRAAGSMKAEKELNRVQQATERVVNGTDQHRYCLKQVVSEQPPHVREQDRFDELLS